MHCLPGIVSESEEYVINTCSHNVALKGHIDQISIQRTAFAGRASDQLKELLRNFQVVPLKENKKHLSRIRRHRVVWVQLFL